MNIEYKEHQKEAQLKYINVLFNRNDYIFLIQYILGRFKDIFLCREIDKTTISTPKHMLSRLTNMKIHINTYIFAFKIHIKCKTLKQ